MFCSNCGAPLDPHQSFCGNCGAPIAAAPVAQQPYGDNIPPQPADSSVPSAGDAGFDPMQPLSAPPAPKKSHKGLIIGLVAAVVLVAGVAVAGMMTNWFGLFSGPLLDLANAFQNNQSCDSVHSTAVVSVTIGQQTMDLTAELDAAVDEKGKPIFYGSFTAPMPDSSTVLTAEIGVRDSQFAVKSQGYSLCYTLPEATDSASVDPLSLSDILQTLKDKSPETYEEINKVLDIDKADDCLTDLLLALNDEDWLTENANFSKTTTADGTVFHFEPDLIALLRLGVEAFQPAFRNENDYQTLRNGLEAYTSILSISIDDLTLEFTVSEEMLTRVYMACSIPVGNGTPASSSIEVKLSNINQTVVDTAKVDALFDGAIDMGDFTGSLG